MRWSFPKFCNTKSCKRVLAHFILSITVNFYKSITLSVICDDTLVNKKNRRETDFLIPVPYNMIPLWVKLEKPYLKILFFNIFYPFCFWVNNITSCSELKIDINSEKNIFFKEPFLKITWNIFWRKIDWNDLFQKISFLTLCICMFFS